MLISILIDDQYLQNVFYFEKGLNGQIHSSSDAQYLIKNPFLVKFPIPPPLGGIFSSASFNTTWKTLISDISRGFLVYR